MSRELIDAMFRFRTMLSPEQIEFALKNDFNGHFNTADGIFGIAQVEMLDGTALFSKHKELIYHVLKDLKEQYKLDYVFLTVPCIDQNMNYLYTIGSKSANFIRKYMARFLDTPTDNQTIGILMRTNKLLLRKEIVPMFEKLEPE
jgi:inorganic pyrophosphatase/exopolyphosphatase